MTGTGVTLGVMAVVVTFLAVALGGFPLTGDSADVAPGVDVPQGSEDFNVNGVESLGDALLISYTDLIDDIASFQTNPSLQRADDRKNKMIGFAQILTGQFKTFSDSMKGELDDLVAEAEAEAEAAGEPSTP